MPRTRPLEDPMGVCGMDYLKGFLWSRAKIRAMMEGSSDDEIIVSHLFSLTSVID